MSKNDRGVYTRLGSYGTCISVQMAFPYSAGKHLDSISTPVSCQDVAEVDVSEERNISVAGYVRDTQQSYRFARLRMTDAIGAERSNQVADQGVYRQDECEKDQRECTCELRRG